MDLDIWNCFGRGNSVSNRITTVHVFEFQTGSESSVDRLMKQISSFMSEISDEFKIVVVQAIQ